MKRFLTQIILFSIIFLLLIVTLHVTRTILHKPFRVDKTVTTLMTGDSHLQCAIDYKNLQGIRNTAYDSEGYFYTYYKLKAIFKNNPHINHVVLGFSYHNLSSFFHDYVLGEYAESVMTRYFVLFDYRVQIQILRLKPSLTIPLIRKLLSRDRNPYPYVGNFPREDSSQWKYDEASMRKRIKHQYYINNELRPVYDLNIEYLDKVIKLCESQGVKVTLITTPLHERYSAEIPEKYKDLYKEIIQKYNLPLIDFRELDLTDEHFLPDGDHLNITGAELATKHFAQRFVVQ